MAASMPGNLSKKELARDAASMYPLEEPQCFRRKWYFSRQEIECHTPSRKDGIDYKRESYFRKLYCTFLQELGMELKVPQVTIASAMMFCHRFYMRQSHAKNDWQTIATVCMFLACKAEETPRWLGELVVVAYKLIFKWDPSASRRIREIYDKQKDLILSGERLLLTTIAFDLNMEHPYKQLVAALKRLDITDKELVRVAWNFVNDWLRTSLCLQHKPHYIAAGSLFLAAKFQKVKLPTANGTVWWMQFDVTPRQLEEVIQQMLGSLEQNRKQALPPKDKMITELKPPMVRKEMSSSPQSCTLSGSIISLDPKLADAGLSTESAMSKCIQNQALANVLRHPKETVICQTSDSASANSVVEDVDGEPVSGKSDPNSSCKIVSMEVSNIRVDVTRIRETMKRRNCDRMLPKFTQAKDMDNEIDGEAWIERELENGIELNGFPHKRSRVEVL